MHVLISKYCDSFQCEQAVSSVYIMRSCRQLCRDVVSSWSTRDIANREAMWVVFNVMSSTCTDPHLHSDFMTILKDMEVEQYKSMMGHSMNSGRIVTAYARVARLQQLLAGLESVSFRIENQSRHAWLHMQTHTRKQHSVSGLWSACDQKERSEIQN